jgi:hypothetical protein
MSYRARYENRLVTAENVHLLPGTQIGDVVQIRHEATEVDLRLFAQLAESLGAPFPDEYE